MNNSDISLVNYCRVCERGIDHEDCQLCLMGDFFSPMEPEEIEVTISAG